MHHESSEESGIPGSKLEENNPAVERNGMPMRSQDQDWFARRGGWWRLALMFMLLAAMAVGLGVGLRFGLRKANGG
ncbi:MAG: hypothetical protein SEPTF4163_005369 [Sporothrix epigloea]